MSDLRLRLENLAAIEAELDALSGPGHPASALKPGVTSANRIAVMGADGYMFIGDGANQWEQQFLGALTVPEAWRQGWPAVFARRQAMAAEQGLRLVNLIVPEKQVILPHKRWLDDAVRGETRPIRHLQAELGDMSRVIYPDDVLRAAHETAPAYFRHNSHWTAWGCCQVARTVLAELGAPDLAGAELAAQRTRVTHDLTVHFFDPAPDEEALYLSAVGDVLDDNRAGLPPGRNQGATYTLRNPAPLDPRRLILFGDSYAFGSGLTYALGAVFAEVVFIWSKSILWDRVKAARADLVLWESAERFLATLPEH